MIGAAINQYRVLGVLEGMTLKHCISAKPVESMKLMELAVQIAETLEEAHEKGIVRIDGLEELDAR